MKRQTYSKEKIAGLEVTQVTNKTIVLPFKQATYSEVLEDKQAYKAFLEKQIAVHPELFPSNIAEGWSSYGFTRPSVKQGIKVRRIQTKADKEVWQIHPSFVMPYMTCDTQTADNILFLAKWTPDWALSRVFKKDVMTIYRPRTSLGRYNLVGTTVKNPAKIPNDVGADEKHSQISGEKV